MTILSVCAGEKVAHRDTLLGGRVIVDINKGEARGWSQDQRTVTGKRWLLLRIISSMKRILLFFNERHQLWYEWREASLGNWTEKLFDESQIFFGQELPIRTDLIWLCSFGFQSHFPAHSVGSQGSRRFPWSSTSAWKRKRQVHF